MLGIVNIGRDDDHCLGKIKVTLSAHRAEKASRLKTKKEAAMTFMKAFAVALPLSLVTIAMTIMMAPWARIGY
jgi:hypothetical protein